MRADNSHTVPEPLPEVLTLIKEMLLEIRAAVSEPHIEKRTAYSPAEIAAKVGREERTVQRWCREGRIKATKRNGRGKTGEWEISHEEFERYRNKGLLSPDSDRNQGFGLKPKN